MASGERKTRLAVLGLTAASAVISATLFAGSAAATTSVEGDCLAGVTPVATGPSDPLTTTITVTWNDECTNVDAYNVERSADNGATWTTVVTGYTTPRLVGSPAQVGSVTDSPTDCGTYIYRVDAIHNPGKALPKSSISHNSNSVTLDTATSSCDDGGTTGTGTCTQLTGAFTLGYYSNKNGQATLQSSDWTSLDGLNLVSANGSAFDPASGAQLRAWLLKATAQNMSYMLSAQLATLQLNINHHVVDPNDQVCEANNTTIGAIAGLANDYLGSYPVVLGGNLVRPDGDALETIIDEINNNLVSVV